MKQSSFSRAGDCFASDEQFGESLFPCEIECILRSTGGYPSRCLN